MEKLNTPDPITVDFVFAGYPQSIIHFANDYEMMIQTETILLNIDNYTFINTDKNKLIQNITQEKANFIKNNALFFLNHHRGEEDQIRDIALVHYTNQEPSVIFFPSGKALREHFENFGMTGKNEVYLLSENNYETPKDLSKGICVIDSENLECYQKIQKIEENIVINIGLKHSLAHIKPGERFFLNEIPKPPYLMESESMDDIKKKIKELDKENNTKLAELYIFKGKEQKSELICKASLILFFNKEKSEDQFAEASIDTKYQTQQCGAAIKFLKKDTPFKTISFHLLVNKQNLEKCTVYKYKKNDEMVDCYNLSLKVLRTPKNKVTHIVIDSLYYSKGISDQFAEVALLIEKEKVLSLIPNPQGNITLTAEAISHILAKDKNHTELKAKEYKVYQTENQINVIGTGKIIHHDRKQNFEEPSKKIIIIPEKKNSKLTRIPSINKIKAPDQNSQGLNL